MVELKDVLMIGAVGGAGLLAYKALKGGFGKGDSYTPVINWDEQKALVKELQAGNTQTQQALLSLMDSLAQLKNPTITVNLPDGGGSGNPPTPTPSPTDPDDGNGNGAELKDFHKQIFDKWNVATTALDEIGTFGPIRSAYVDYLAAADRSRAATIDTPVSDLSDDMQKAAMTGFQGVGLEPAAAGTLGNLISDMALGGPFGAITTLIRGFF